MSKNALTARERDILRLITKGMTDREIAEVLVLTVGTVKWYNRQIYSKLHVSNRTEAVTYAQQIGLLRSSDEGMPTAPRAELPAPVTSFIGRRHELPELKARLITSRLVTLTGPPGAGKTRLGLQVALEIAGNYRDGAYFVPLASLVDPQQVVQSAAHVLDVRETGQESLLTTLKNRLRERQLLLLMDNFEHLLPAAPLVTELLAAAPALTILITSREVLRLYGEHEFPVPPLIAPDLRTGASTDALKTFDAVELFVQRAQAVSPTFILDDDNADAVASICAHLDGLPLAIELAAARTKFYAPQSLLIRLGSRLEALSDGPRDLPARQRTLRATLGWSYDLLDAEEKILFARLGIFVGGWTLNDAEAVCGNGLKQSISVGIESLVNKSLVQQIPTTDEMPHFMYLETMREFALEKLEESGEKSPIYERYVQHYLALAEAAVPEMYGTDGAKWFEQLEWQHNNFRSSLHRCLTTGQAQTGLRLIGGLSRFWEVRGYLSEGLAWLSSMLGLNGAEQRTKARADALNGGGDLAYLQCKYELAHTYYSEAKRIYNAVGSQAGAAHALIGLGEVATEIGDYDTAPNLFQEAYALLEQLGDVRGCARARTQLGWGALRVGDYNQARVWLQQGLLLYQQVDDRVAIALSYSGLGEIAIREDELELAATLLEKSLNLRRELDQRWGIATSLGSLAWVALKQARYQRAADLLEESLRIRLDLGDKGGIAWCLEKLAKLAYLQDDPIRAVRIFSAAAALRASVNSIIDPSDQDDYQVTIDRLRNTLDEHTFQILWEQGLKKELAEIVQYAFSHIDSTFDPE